MSIRHKEVFSYLSTLRVIQPFLLLFKLLITVLKTDISIIYDFKALMFTDRSAEIVF